MQVTMVKQFGCGRTRFKDRTEDILKHWKQQSFWQSNAGDSRQFAAIIGRKEVFKTQRTNTYKNHLRVQGKNQLQKRHLLLQFASFSNYQFDCMFRLLRKKEKSEGSFEQGKALSFITPSCVHLATQPSLCLGIYFKHSDTKMYTRKKKDRKTLSKVKEYRLPVLLA